MGWKKGQSGNPSGKKWGTRDKLNAKFLKELGEHFEAHGREAIEEVFQTDKNKYLSIVAALQPRETASTVDINDVTDRESYSETELLTRLVSVIERGGKAGTRGNSIGADESDMGADAGATNGGITH